MEQFLFFCITVSILVLKVDSQTQIPNVLNPDQIYFDDNKPNTNNHVNRQINEPNVNLQPPYNTPNEAQLPINGLNFDQRPANILNLAQSQFPNNANVARQPSTVNQISGNAFNTGQQQVNYFPTINQRRPEEDIQNVNEILNVRVDQNAAALTNFSLGILRSVIEQRQANAVVSPYSIATLLSLLQQGAVDQSLEQITVALQMSPQMSAAFYKNHGQDVKSRSSRNIFTTGNNVFVADGFSISPQFRGVAINDFDSAVTSTNFRIPESAAQLINGWVASKTNYKINKLIAPESIPISTQMVLVNAVYFKGIWEVPFRAQVTKQDTFQLRNGATKQVPFMTTRRHFRAGIDSYTDSRIIVLPFERQEYSLMIILPSKLSNVDMTIQSLTVPQLESYLNLRPMEVALQIPKFTIKADTDLAPVLRQMGVTNIFQQSSGLAGLGLYRGITPQVSSAIHSAVLSIDEEGGTAAAATAFTVVALSNDAPSLTLKVDRPFVAILWDGKTRLPLFMAKIEDPSL